jgi:preprotein translocase subunit SecD
MPRWLLCVVSVAVAVGGCVRPVPRGVANPNVLQFRAVADEAGEGTETIVVREGGKKEVLHLRKEALLTAADVRSAQAGTQPQLGDATVCLALTDEGRRKLFEATKGSVGRRLAILVEGRVLSAPTVQHPIQGDAVITGDFTRAEARALAAKINAARGAP